MILERILESPLLNNAFNIFSEEEDDIRYSYSDNNRAYATIDGGVITQDEVKLAVDKGSGIFVGNYFVGVTESYQCYINSPFGRFS